MSDLVDELRRDVLRRDVDHVLQALDPRGLRLTVLEDAGGEIGELDRVLVGRLEGELLALAATHHLEGHRDVVEIGIVQPDPAVLSENAKDGARLLAEARVHLGEPRRESA